MSYPVPIILDTDIGEDIDDTWALALALRSPELDLKLVVTDSGNTTYRARVAAKMLESVGRTEVPVGVGLHQSDSTGPQSPWVAGYALSDYPGPVHEDGVGALIDTIMSSPEAVTLVCIGPLPNIAAALDREPGIVRNARFVGMYGSVRTGYGGRPEVSAEYNVRADPAACRKALGAGWEVTITPLDTCGLVVLQGDKYARVRDHPDPLVRALMENYRIWAKAVPWTQADPDKASSTLFDTVAVYLTLSEELLVIEELGLRVTTDGFTVEDGGVRRIRCATAWRDLPAFEDFVVRRLTEVPVGPSGRGAGGSPAAPTFLGNPKEVALS